jgi:hypothetical protein
MKKGRKLETSKDLVRALARFFAVGTDEPETPDEVNAGLRELGYDPDEVGARMKAAAERALASSSLNWRSRAQRELEDERARIADSVKITSGTRADIIEAIKRLAMQSGDQMAYAYRNLKSMTDDDLVGLLSDLEYLASKRGGQGEE